MNFSKNWLVVLLLSHDTPKKKELPSLHPTDVLIFFTVFADDLLDWGNFWTEMKIKFKLTCLLSCFSHVWLFVRGAGEAFCSWQRSWGRKLGIRKGGIEPQESPRIFSSIFPPKTRVCLLYCLVLSPLTLLGAVPYHHLSLSVKELTYSSN